MLLQTQNHNSIFHAAFQTIPARRLASFLQKIILYSEIVEYSTLSFESSEEVARHFFNKPIYFLIFQQTMGHKWILQENFETICTNHLRSTHKTVFSKAKRLSRVQVDVRFQRGHHTLIWPNQFSFWFFL